MESAAHGGMTILLSVAITTRMATARRIASFVAPVVSLYALSPQAAAPALPGDAVLTRPCQATVTKYSFAPPAVTQPRPPSNVPTFDPPTASEAPINRLPHSQTSFAFPDNAVQLVTVAGTPISL